MLGLKTTPEIVVSDNCTPDSNLPLDISNFLLESECPESRVLQRQASSTDACGNVGQASHLVTILDTTPPVFVWFPEDVTLPCHSNPELPWPTVSDDCSSWEVVVSKTPLGWTALKILILSEPLWPRTPAEMRQRLAHGVLQGHHATRT